MVFRIHKYSYTFNGEAGLVNSRWFMASCSRRILCHKEHAKMSCAVQISKRLVDCGRSCGKPMSSRITFLDTYDDVIKWKHFPRNWPFVRGIHRSLVNSTHKVQWRGALMFSLICVWINDRVNNREAGDLRRYRAHYDVIVMFRMDCQYSVHGKAPCHMLCPCTC